MFSPVGIALGEIGEANTEPEVMEQAWSMRSFYVPQASGSALIPHQTGFVEPYNIQSVLGLGNLFVSGAGALILAFASVSIVDEAVDRFVELTPYLMTLMAAFDQTDQLWD